MVINLLLRQPYQLQSQLSLCVYKYSLIHHNPIKYDVKRHCRAEWGQLKRWASLTSLHFFHVFPCMLFVTARSNIIF